jgi:Ca-activated chloride channel homolog
VSSLLRHSRALACAALLSVASIVPSAQEPPQTTPPAVAPPAQIEVWLTGGKGNAVPEPKREDVRVFVDGLERPVLSFEKQSGPVSYGLMVDNSGSLRSQIERVTPAAVSLVAQNGPGDETFVLRFVASDSIRILQPFTSNQAAVNKALESMYIEGGHTALLDALHVAGEYLLKNASRADAPKRRLALVLVSDGEDRESTHKLEQVMKLLRDGGVRVFCIGLTRDLEGSPGIVGKSKRDLAKKMLAKIADDTGGRFFYAEEVGELEEAVADVVRSMRASYVVGYAPPDAAAKGSGKVEVKLVGAPGKEKLRAQVKQ